MLTNAENYQNRNVIRDVIGDALAPSTAELLARLTKAAAPSQAGLQAAAKAELGRRLKGANNSIDALVEVLPDLAIPAGNFKAVIAALSVGGSAKSAGYETYAGARPKIESDFLEKLTGSLRSPVETVVGARARGRR
jgi:hypothetical protein